MKYYLLNAVQRIKQYGKQLDAESVLYNKNWIVFNDGEDKEKFIFRPRKELLISKNGVVSKARWELLTTGTILVEIGDFTYLFNAVFRDNIFLILQLDGNKDYLILYDNKMLTNKVIKSIQDVENLLDKKCLPVCPTKLEPRAETKPKPEPSPLLPIKQRILIVSLLILFIIITILLNLILK